jgi:glycerol-3-phosphate dehydrogenase (NAD(P)+)
MDERTVAVIGGGSWGIALAAAAARAGTRAMLVTRRDVQVFPRGVDLCRSAEIATSQAKLVVVATPSSRVVEVLQGLRAHLGKDHIVVHSVRGLVGPSLATIGDVVRAETSVEHVGALGGPVLASDLLAGNPSVVVCGTTGDEVGYAFTRAFVTPTVRVYTTSDLRGVEWSCALVGCLAIVVGYAQRLGFNPGIIAALTTRGVHEMSQMVTAAGGAPQTPLGLAGYGDVLAYVTQRGRPELRLGSALARGMTVEDAAAAVPQRVEGVELVPRLVSWANDHKLRVPIFRALAERVFRAAPPADIAHELMTLPVEDPG